MFERLSAHPTPTASPPPPGAGPRAFSPAPRRPNAPSGLARPPFNARSSSLSLVSRQNSSTGSLVGPTAAAATGRAPNGSALRRELSPTRPVEDPLAVLEQIVGAPPPQTKAAEADDEAEAPPERPAELVADIDFGGLSLEEFARRGTAVPPRARAAVAQLDAQPVAEYEQERDKFEDLHRSIQACDGVLRAVEGSLAGFQRDLGAVSREIEALQARSAALDGRLARRRAVEARLGPAVEAVAIPPGVVAAISEGAVDEQFLHALGELQKKLDAVGKQDPAEQEGVRAYEDAKPLLENLKNKALERARDYIVTQIKAVRSPNMNAQIIQQQRLLRFAPLHAFLARHHPPLAAEIAQAYVHTMRWYYLAHFARYRDALAALPLVRYDKADLLGAEPAAPRPRTAASAPPGHDAHALGRRGAVLDGSAGDDEAERALPAHVAEDAKAAHHIETAFRSLTLALVDNVSAEYAFQAAFFAGAGGHGAAARHSAAIWTPTFALAQAFVGEHLATAGAHDCLGLLLCVRLGQRAAFALQRRRCPAADAFVNGAALTLWPRFQRAMDAHAESLRAAGAQAASRGAAGRLTSAATAAAAATVGGGGGGGGAGGAEAAARQAGTAPHPLTQRFAQFVRGIAAVSKDAGDDEPVASSLGRLRTEYLTFLEKAGRGAGAEARKRDRFLANNYALVLTILGDVGGKLADEVRGTFERLSREVADRNDERRA